MSWIIVIVLPVSTLGNYGGILYQDYEAFGGCQLLTCYRLFLLQQPIMNCVLAGPCAMRIVQQW